MNNCARDGREVGFDGIIVLWMDERLVLME